ncbi:MAG: hypothetical protein ACSHW7_01350 [Patiriisocius sp.]|uniref:hypothetical protein n=1 Tax=Patiriisocius sp. TaxID=2822396 RepID=UPI003EFAE556
MTKLKIEFENCYGIKQLKYDFDFSVKSTYAIYAPNGTMKTSFANTFMDFSNSNPSKDSIFPARINKRIITDENGDELKPEEIFVIVPYNEAFKSQKLSTLLVNKELKERYDEIHLNINEKKDTLTKELISKSGLKKGVDAEFSTDFTSYSTDFFKAIGRVKTEVNDETEAEFSDIVYSKVFSQKVIAFLETKDFKTKLQEYIEKYNDLVDTSTYFQKGVFNHNNASTIAKNLKDNGFFKAKHSLILNAETDKKQISTEEELTEIIQAEKDAILNNPDLLKAFNDIDNALTKNIELKDFRDYLLANQKILPELPNINGFKQKIWVSYLKEFKQLFLDLDSEYNKGKEEIEKIVAQAKLEETDWRTVIGIFNKRFSVPFKLKVKNQEDVILKRNGPSIVFEFIDNADKCEIDESKLHNVLSNGEKRALYILNIIFEVQARLKDLQKTIFIIDDIADSFDYKNKYAIIEYLKDISNHSIFNQIVLSHNYDFFRTISSRLDMERRHKLNSIKTGSNIILKQELYQNNPFDYWKEHLDKPEMLIASIPFIRNLAEFTGDEVNFLKLTSLLHIKSDTANIKISDLQIIFKEILKDKHTLTLANPNKLVTDLIFETADTISVGTDEIIELENKITLAIGIRLKAEIFMINKINDNAFVNSITKHQTSVLFAKYVELFPAELIIIDLLEQVNLMTPENIHLNSFMYEPILDMGNEHLKDLYIEISAL